MIALDEYKKHRVIGKELNIKIMDYLFKKIGKAAIEQSAKVLGFLEGKNRLVFDSEEEVSVMQDFALNEYRINSKTAIEIYQEEVGAANEIEAEILAALILAQTSLFKVTAKFEEKGLLMLDDLLNAESNIELMDISFSETAVPGMLLFIRLVRGPAFNRSSGISFVFYDEPATIVRKYKNIYARIKPQRDSRRRFIAFFKLNKLEGKAVRYS